MQTLKTMIDKYYNKDNNAGTAISKINYWKLNPH